jgi:hypothetical protein
VSGLADAYGYGTDPDGDAARRAAIRGAKIPPGGWRTTLRDALRAAAEADARRIAADTRAILGDAQRQIPGHRLDLERTAAGNTIARCECGRWDGGWTGPRSRTAVLLDHAQHAAAELRQEEAAPIRVTSERADQPKELEP